MKTDGRCGTVSFKLAEACPSEAPSDQGIVGNNRGSASTAEIKRYLPDNRARSDLCKIKGATPSLGPHASAPGFDKIHVLRRGTFCDENRTGRDFDPFEIAHQILGIRVAP